MRHIKLEKTALPVPHQTLSYVAESADVTVVHRPLI